MSNSPEEFCRIVRESFDQSEFVYKNGSCFEFFLMLKFIYPEAEPWTNIDHVWTKIGEKFYDIEGVRKEGSDGLFPMNEDPRLLRNAYEWKALSSWKIV